MRVLCTPTPAIFFALMVIFLSLFLVGPAEAFSSSAVTRAVLPKATHVQDFFHVMPFNTVISSNFVIPTVALVASQFSVLVMLK